MELGIDVEKIKRVLSWRNIKKSLFDFILNKMRVLVFILMFIMTGFFVYLWYFYIYNSDWSEYQKQEYILNKDKGVTFNEKLFDSIVEETDARSLRFQKVKSELEDIFRLEKAE